MSLSKTARTNLRADAMQRSATNYDDLRPCTPVYPNSLSPGRWLMETLVSEVTDSTDEHIKSARSIAHAYQFGPRWKLLRYAGAEGPRNRDGGEVFAGHLEYETKSLCYTNPHAHPMPDAPVFSGTAWRNAELKAESRRDEGVSQPHYRYKLVSDVEINEQYARFLTGAATVDSVMELVTDSCKRRIALGTMEFELRQRGMSDDLLAPFCVSIQKKLEDATFTLKPGSLFSTYVNVAWRNRRNTAYSHVSRNDKRTLSNDPFVNDREDGGDTGEVSGPYDDFAVRQNNEDMLRIASAADARDRLAAHMADLNSIERTMVEDLIAETNQHETATRLDVSRHQVGYVQRKFKKAVREGKVA